MKNENNENTPQNARPEIEDAIHATLSGNALKNSLDFVASMRANGFSFEGSDTGNAFNAENWVPTYKGKGIGCINVAPKWSQENDEFILWLGLECDFGGSADDELKEFAWAHVAICPQEKHCKPPYCANNKNRWKIFGKEYGSACHAPLVFWNPDAKVFENIKKLMLVLKENRSSVPPLKEITIEARKPCRGSSY